MKFLGYIGTNPLFMAQMILFIIAIPYWILIPAILFGIFLSINNFLISSETLS